MGFLPIGMLPVDSQHPDYLKALEQAAKLRTIPNLGIKIVEPDAFAKARDTVGDLSVRVDR